MYLTDVNCFVTIHQLVLDKMETKELLLRLRKLREEMEEEEENEE